ncbi:PREDICTED: nuclear factor of activated T-cells 5 isoform X5 [Bactrocera latifrons]|uniref:nuclear factor of activated T-cells 5 isoform X5 n=1 Tax=Bactrocera latifrons TaxID=174628 RepID=UPI0008DDF49A|nr:PREDICTED: nuclear factor of activated T-cells 5 isoform X5 [Bactrocera latifrons]
MRFTYNQYNYSESGYRIPSKMHNSNTGNGSLAAAHPHHYRSNFGMRMTMSTASTMTARIQRKGFRTPSKRYPGKAIPSKLHSVSRIGPGKLVPGKRFPPRPHPPPCDNSNDSGFGFDQHVEVQQQQQLQAHHHLHSASGSSASSSSSSSSSGSGSPGNSSDIMQNNNNTATNLSINNNNTSSNGGHHHGNNHHHHHHGHGHHHSSSAMPHSAHVIRAIPASRFIPTGPRAMTRVAHKRQPAVPQNTIVTSSNGRVQLEIVSQPEQQHRARYQTEGSRGAVKDRSGNGFPIVRLTGYNKPAVLQVFIGTDIGRVAPHMFYQACKVAGKNSTQCNEKKVDGTMVIEIDFKPESDMTVTCDCVGILKERNVDVEHRFPDHLAQKNKKKSTRCRMVFRTQLTHDDGTLEMLQVCSNPIICTQPPGVPEICKKSLTSCPVDGGLELFIIGKNFLKDTHVLFQETYESVPPNEVATELAVRQHLGGALWEQTVLPDKEYLQQTHLVCVVPPYIHQNIIKPVTVQLIIISSGKKSEPHAFVYTPKGSYTTLAAATTLSSAALHGSLSAAQDANTFMDTTNALAPALGGATGAGGGAGAVLWPAGTETKQEIDSGMMPPPITTQMPMGVRRPSLPTATPMLTDQQLVRLNVADTLKTELIDDTSQSSLADAIQAPDVVMANCAAPISPSAMQFHAHYDHKNSMDAMMFDSNSMSAFPVAAAVELAVKTNIAKAVAQQQQAVAVDKFITDLTKSTAVADDPTVAAVVEETLFSGVGDVNSAVSAVIDHPFGDIMQQQQSPAVLERSLSISSNSSSNSNSSSGSSPHTGLTATLSVSPNNSLNGHNSPITQDIILNSEPAAVLNAMPMQQLLPTALGGSPNAAVSPNVVVEAAVNVQGTPNATAVADPTGGISTEMIMNPAVSPSTILCSANGAATAVVPNIMAPHQVTMANSILNDIAMQPQPTQQHAAVAALALSNIIMSPTSAPGAVVDDVASVEQTVDQPADVTVATSTAVSNLIIKAAADLISTQEKQQQQQHIQQQHQQIQQQQQQHIQQQHQQIQQQQQQIQQQQQQIQQQQLQQQHLHHHQQAAAQQQQQHQPTQALMNGAAAATTASTSPLVNLLLNHPDAPPSAAVAAAAVSEVQSQFSLAIPPTAAPQESLIVALATENSMQKSVAAAAVTTNGAVVTQQTTAPAAGILPGAAVGPVPLPQELTTMSDQDLLSYINPSTFDQI